MHIGQMFPKKTLHAEDLFSEYPGGVVVTIEGIKARTDPGEIGGEPEVTYFMATKEFRKPIRLNKTSATIIAGVVGSEDTDDWHGKTVTIRGFSKQITDRDTGKPKKIWVTEVEMEAPLSLPLPNMVKHDITGVAASRKRLTAGRPGQGPGPIGAETSLKIAQSLHERGKNMGDLAGHLANLGLNVAGQLPPAWPASALEPSRIYLRNLPKVGPPMTPAAVAGLATAWGVPPPGAAEVVDTRTGEVIRPAAPAALPARPAPTPAAPAHQMPPDHEEIREEDIPF